MKSDRATMYCQHLVLGRVHDVMGALKLTPILESHGLGEGLRITLETGDRLVVQTSNGLWEDVTSTCDTTLVSGDKSGQKRLGESWQDLELAGDGCLLKSRLVL